MSDMEHKVKLAKVRSSILLSRFKPSVSPNKRAYDRNRAKGELRTNREE